MQNKIDLKKIESKAFTFSFKDGLLDIFLGCIFLQFSIAPLLTDIGFSDLMASAVFIPFYIIILIAFFLLKKHLTKPRIGSFKPNPKRKSKLIWLNLIIFVILLIGFLIGLFYNPSPKTSNAVYPLIFSGLVLLISFIATYYLELNRLFYYGVLVAVAPLIGELLWNRGLVSHHGFPLMFGIISISFIVIGVILLVKFLQNHSIPISEENNAIR